MAHACSCHLDSVAEAKGHPTCGGRETVGDAVRNLPGAREILGALGVNHCCGAHLTLAEAAASASVPLEVVLAKLDELRRVSA